MPNKPYAIRLNCKSGSINKTEMDRICDEIDVSIIKIAQFFGDLGKTKGEEWFQIFCVPLPGQKVPANTVCVTYIKRESLSIFGDKITEIVASGVNPATGIFTIKFEPRTGEKGQYFVAIFHWRKRETDEEHEQLDQIKAFMEGPMSKHLVDMNTTRDMVPLEGLDADDRQALVSAYRQGLSPAMAYRAVIGEDVETLLLEAAQA